MVGLTSLVAVETTAAAGAEEPIARPSVALLAGYALESRRFIAGGMTSITKRPRNGSSMTWPPR